MRYDKVRWNRGKARVVLRTDTFYGAVLINTGYGSVSRSHGLGFADVDYEYSLQIKPLQHNPAQRSSTQHLLAKRDSVPCCALWRCTK